MMDADIKKQLIKRDSAVEGEVVYRNPYEDNSGNTSDSVMSNFDHEIDRDVAKRLQTENICVHYAGWNFSGTVWYDKKAKVYRCEVWQYHQYMETVSGTLEQIMEAVSNKYGWD